MSEVRISLYRGRRFPAEVIAHLVWTYFRFPLSLRMIEELLAARGIIVSHETVRRWAELSLAFLAPDLVKAAAEGHLPRGFGIKRLIDLPIAWNEQWSHLGLIRPAPATALRERLDR